MNRKIRSLVVILVILILLAVILGGMLIWRLIEINRLEKIHQVIQDAWDQSKSEDMPEYLSHIDMYSNFSVEEMEEGEPWVITVRVQGVDLAEQLRNADLTQFSEDTPSWEMDQYLVSMVNKADIVYVDCYVYLYPEGDDFRVQFTETFVDAMSGMALSYAREMAQEAMRGVQ